MKSGHLELNNYMIEQDREGEKGKGVLKMEF